MACVSIEYIPNLQLDLLLSNVAYLEKNNANEAVHLFDPKCPFVLPGPVRSQNRMLSSIQIYKDVNEVFSEKKFENFTFNR